jgi:hypothetical protein
MGMREVDAFRRLVVWGFYLSSFVFASTNFVMLHVDLLTTRFP